MSTVYIGSLDPITEEIPIVAKVPAVPSVPTVPAVTPAPSTPLVNGGLIIQAAIAVAVLAAVGVLGALGHITTAQTYNATLAIIGAGGISAGITLGSSKPNSNLIPHLLLTIAVLGLTGAMAAKGVFSNAESAGILALIIGGGALGVGSVTPASS